MTALRGRIEANTTRLAPVEELVLLVRALDRIGYNDHNAGHVTYRQSDGTFLTLAGGLGWSEVELRDVIRIDIDGRKLEGERTPPTPIKLHLEFHRMWPGRNVTIHQHPAFATVYAALGRLPAVYDQSAAAIRDDEVAIYRDYGGPVNDTGNARSAVAGMEGKDIALLQNHGVFVAAQSVPQMFHRCAHLEWRCRRGWFVEALEGGIAMPESARQSIRDLFASWDDVLPGQWEWAVRREARADREQFGHLRRFLPDWP